MIIGAGKMGEACVRHLAKKAARAVLVANRSFERAEALAAEFGGRAVHFEDLRTAMVEADIVVSSTGCQETILHKGDVATVMAARRNRPLFLIDIAVPRDIDAEVQELSQVYLYNVDHLESIVRENLRQREHELARCQDLIAARVTALMQRFAPPPAKPAPPAMPAPAGWALGAVAA